METPTTILIVEDDADIRALVCALLTSEGFAVEQAKDAIDMDDVLGRICPDLIILDLMLPGEDGLSICRRLCNSYAVPILMLTAKGEEIDRVLGLEMGADDYLVKPFGPRELLARVRALIRRVKSKDQPAPMRRLAFDKFIVDLDGRVVIGTDGPDLGLTSAEFDLLACFVQRPRRVLTRDQILDWTHGRNSDPFDRTVDMLVSRVRKKLDASSPGSKLITTVRNGGYLFTATVKTVT
ncbi:response regulator transcription factor [Rhizobium pusense]|uniref:response regulator n=1 Tax=Agrobacterium TaxID=357 RepID=UPI000DC01440|nr:MULTISPECIES: response regulator transcription factor [Agrobacterium]MDH0117791.1 response regulator transcription factor [Agrobacterium pusense]RAL97206.1 DNA-binding response regulator [Agrobacterium sp. MS2]